MNAEHNLWLPCHVALPLIVVAFAIGVICPTFMLAAPTSELVADINGDGEVNVFDACIMSSNWGMEGMEYAEGNIDGDNLIDARDAGIMIENWTGDSDLGPCADVNCDGEVDGLDAGVMSSNWGMEGLGYAEGNINGDNYIDTRDANLMIENWTGNARVEIPEPSTLFLSALAAVGLLMRRW